MSELSVFALPQRLLLGPGPSEVHPDVLAAMSRPLLGHLDPDFMALMAGAQANLRKLYRTTSPLTYAASGTGMAGMETCLVNLLEPGDSLLVFANGYFGPRMTDIGERLGCKVTQFNRPYGEAFDLQEIREHLVKHKPKAMGIVHAETSTGALQPGLGEIGKLCRETGTLLVVDMVTSLGGVPVEFDEWGIDAAYSGTQKCISAPPGLSPVAFSQRAIDAMNARKSKPVSWYLDATMIAKYLGQERVYHHTAPISMIYAMTTGLELVFNEGLEARFARHRRNHLALKSGIEAMGLKLATNPAVQMPQLNPVRVPSGMDEVPIRKRLLTEFGIEVGGGLGEFKGQVWRIGLMGYASSEANVLRVLDALDECLAGAGVRFPSGAATRAAEDFYNTGAVAQATL